MKIEIYDDVSKGLLPPDRFAEISETVALETWVFKRPDVSDPLNNVVVVGFKAGGRLAVNAPFDSKDGDRTVEAIRSLLIYAIDHAAELRDLLKE